MSGKKFIKWLIQSKSYEQLFVDFLIEPIEILAVVDGTQQALASVLLAGASLKTGIESKVWKVSQGIPEGSFTQYLSDLA
jgi:hypothetical protein